MVCNYEKLSRIDSPSKIVKVYNLSNTLVFLAQT